MIALRTIVAPSLALALSSCVSASTTLGESHAIDEVSRLTPGELDATPLTAPRVTIVSLDHTRRDVRGVFRLDDMLVAQGTSGAEDLVPLDTVECVELSTHREVRAVTHAKAVHWGSAILWMGAGVALIGLAVVATTK